MAEEDIAPQVGAALEAGEEEEEAVMRIGERPGARSVVQQSASDRSVEESCWGAGCPGLLIYHGIGPLLGNKKAFCCHFLQPC